MKKNKKLNLDNETIERIVNMAQEEKKPFEAIKNEFGISEKEVILLMKKQLTNDKFELWKKKAGSSKPKPKLQKYNDIEDDDLDTKYYFKNKFD